MKRNDYTFREVLDLYQLIPNPDYIFVSSGLAGLGFPEAVQNLDDLCEFHINALRESFPHSTLVFPSYSYTFGQSIPNSLATYTYCTPSKIGPLSNYLIKQEIGLRSIDLMVSVITVGNRQSTLISDLPYSSYGIDCVFDRLLNSNTLCLSIGLGSNWTPFIHYFDYLNNAPYRYDKSSVE